MSQISKSKSLISLYVPWVLENLEGCVKFSKLVCFPANGDPDPKFVVHNCHRGSATILVAGRLKQFFTTDLLAMGGQTSCVFGIGVASLAFTATETERIFMFFWSVVGSVHWELLILLLLSLIAVYFSNTLTSIFGCMMTH